MSKVLFSKSEVEKLKKNIYVKNVSSKSITYTDDFKLHFIAEYQKEIPTVEIFNSVGLDTSLLGERRVHNALGRCRKAYEKNGVMGLRDTRRGNSGRPLEREQQDSEDFKLILKAYNFKGFKKGSRSLYMTLKTISK